LKCSVSSMNFLEKEKHPYSTRKPVFFAKKTAFVPPQKKSFVFKTNKYKLNEKSVTKRAALPVPLEDVHLYALTSADLFAFYATRAFVTTHAPVLLMYRGVFRLPWTISAFFLLFVSVFKCFLETY